MFGMEIGKMFVWKGHDKEKIQKRVVQLWTLTKISWFLVCKLGYSRKKMGREHILSWEKKLKFLGLLFYPWKFWTKQNYSSQKNHAKLYDTYWEWSQIPCDFFFIDPENFSYILFSPRKFHILFLQYSWKSQVLQ